MINLSSQVDPFAKNGSLTSTNPPEKNPEGIKADFSKIVQPSSLGAPQIMREHCNFSVLNLGKLKHLNISEDQKLMLNSLMVDIKSGKIEKILQFGQENEFAIEHKDESTGEVNYLTTSQEAADKLQIHPQFVNNTTQSKPHVFVVPDEYREEFIKIVYAAVQKYNIPVMSQTVKPNSPDESKPTKTDLARKSSPNTPIDPQYRLDETDQPNAMSSQLGQMKFSVLILLLKNAVNQFKQIQENREAEKQRYSETRQQTIEDKELKIEIHKIETRKIEIEKKEKNKQEDLSPHGV